MQLVDGEMNPVSEALCKTTDAIDYHEFTDLATDRIYYGRVRANFPYSSTSDWVYVTANEQPAMLMASVGILELDPKLTLNAATGSTLTYEWSYTDDAATDATRLYNIELFRDEACSELHVSWLADGKLASDKGIFTALAGYPVVRFTFSGLDPETTYYARVTNASFGNIMTPVVAGTTAKAGPKASQNNPAQAGDIDAGAGFRGIHPRRRHRPLGGRLQRRIGYRVPQDVGTCHGREPAGRRRPSGLQLDDGVQRIHRRHVGRVHRKRRHERLGAVGQHLDPSGLHQVRRRWRRHRHPSIRPSWRPCPRTRP